MYLFFMNGLSGAWQLHDILCRSCSGESVVFIQCSKAPFTQKQIKQNNSNKIPTVLIGLLYPLTLSWHFKECHCM